MSENYYENYGETRRHFSPNGSQSIRQACSVRERETSIIRTGIASAIWNVNSIEFINSIYCDSPQINGFIVE